MSEWELRLLLLIIGIVILVVIYVFGTQKKPPVETDLGDDEESEIEHMKGSLASESKSQEAYRGGFSGQAQELDEMVREEAEFRSSHYPGRGVPRSSPPCARVIAPGPSMKISSFYTLRQSAPMYLEVSSY